MMQVSSKTEYGIRCLLHLARQGGKALSISQIATQEQIPRQFSQQIFLQLRRAGIVKSIRGTQGGFALASAPSQISIGEVIRLLEGVPLLDTCNHFNRRTSCGHLGSCSIRPIWQIISQRLWEALDRIHLEHLLTDEQAVGHTLASELPVLMAPTRKES